MECTFCKNGKHKESCLPSTKFNGKLFNYLLCKNCKLIYTSPIPNTNDFKKMYPPSYQAGADKTILPDIYKKIIGLRYSYGYQFDLIKKYHPNGLILDYGCGTANFIANAEHQGLQCAGAEYNKEHISALEKSMSNPFYLINDVLSGKAGKFDIIRLSKRLRALTKPNRNYRSINNPIKQKWYSIN